MFGRLLGSAAAGCAIGVLWAGAAAPAWGSADFVVDDVEVCPASADVVDPEFHPDGDRVVYMNTDGRVRVAGVLPDGSIDSPGCDGLVVDTDSIWTLPNLVFRQGPEWGVSALGSEIIHTRTLPDGRFALARIWQDAGNWRQEVLKRGEDRGMPVVSRDVADPNSRIMYLRLAAGKYIPSWRESNQPFSETALKVSGNSESGGVPRWVPGTRWVSTAVADADGVFQAAIYDIDTRLTRFLTTGPERNDEVWLWRAPEFDEGWAMLTVEDSCCLAIYRETAGEFVKVLTYDVRTLAGLNKIYSPEPVVYAGRSFVAFQASNLKLDKKSQIWVVAADPARPLARQVSAGGRAVRIEPEWVETPAGLFVYYTQYGDDKLSALRRAATGL